ncbi:MAG: sugar transferase [Bacilli bacterium]|jgi:lipopolysaccharide/colanic/teichoic acid biosynthesis glycosyltransferase|nr:sugar transferase [Bacilli bacterium]
MVEPEETPFVIRSIPTYNFFKRAFDIFNSLLALIVLSPLMLLTAILVKITSPGPIIYVSQRVGMRGKVFNFYKFRSMYKDADARLEALLAKNEVAGGVTFKMKDDPRVTPFGRFIRRTSIDELPQLVNILKGDMSIVGPRPCTVREYNLYDEYDKLRLSVPQGLTGVWQTSGRSHTSFDMMIEMDLDYIERKRGFFYDIWLIIKTVGVTIGMMFGKDGGAE